MVEQRNGFKEEWGAYFHWVEQLTESMKKSSTNTAPKGRIPEMTELQGEGEGGRIEMNIARRDSKPVVSKFPPWGVGKSVAIVLQSFVCR